MLEIDPAWVPIVFILVGILLVLRFGTYRVFVDNPNLQVDQLDQVFKDWAQVTMIHRQANGRDVTWQLTEEDNSVLYRCNAGIGIANFETISIDVPWAVGMVIDFIDGKAVAIRRSNAPIRDVEALPSVAKAKIAEFRITIRDNVRQHDPDNARIQLGED